MDLHSCPIHSTVPMPLVTSRALPMKSIWPLVTALTLPVTGFTEVSYAQPPGGAAPTSGNVERWAGRLGITAEALCAAGVPASALSAFVGRVRDVELQRKPAIEVADEEASAARAALDAVMTDRSGSPADRAAAVTAARSRLAAATAAVRVQESTAFEDCIEDLAEASREALRTIRRNAGHPLPIAYLMVDRSPAEWKALGEALRRARVATSLGQTIDPLDNVTISSAESHPAVAAAQALLVPITGYRAAFAAALVPVNQ